MFNKSKKSTPTKEDAEVIIDQSGYAIFVTFPVKEGQAERFAELMKYNTLESRKEPGVLVYRTYQSEDNPNVFHNFEVYTNKDALDYHRDTPHVQYISPILDEIMAGPIEVQGVLENKVPPKGPND